MNPAQLIQSLSTARPNELVDHHTSNLGEANYKKACQCIEILLRKKEITVPQARKLLAVAEQRLRLHRPAISGECNLPSKKSIKRSGEGRKVTNINKSLGGKGAIDMTHSVRGKTKKKGKAVKAHYNMTDEQAKALRDKSNDKVKNTYRDRMLELDAKISRASGDSLHQLGMNTKSGMGNVDWKNEASVIAYANSLGSGMTVYKHPDRDNFNITHTSRLDVYAGCYVIHKS